MSTKVKITPSQILGYLEQGMTREEIGEKLGLSKKDVTLMFKHPELKGRRTHSVPGFEFVDSSDDVQDVDFEETSDEEFTGDASVTSEEETVEHSY